VNLQTHQMKEMKEEFAYHDAVKTRANLGRVNIEKELDNVKVLE